MIERSSDDHGVVTLQFQHGKANALDLELCRALASELESLHDASALILTGTGSIFSAGVDLFRVVNEGPSYVRAFFPALADMIRTLFTFPRPVIAAANGHAIAGGCIMVLAADYRLMADGKGRIGVPELLVGVPFPAFALEAVRYAVPACAQSLILTGKTLTPADALDCGLIDEILEPASLLMRAAEVAAQMSAIPRATFLLTKQQLRAPAVDRADRLGVAIDPAALEIWASESTRTQIRAYLERTVRKSAL